jgi:hypothetical protein
MVNAGCYRRLGAGVVAAAVLTLLVAVLTPSSATPAANGRPSLSAGLPSAPSAQSVVGSLPRATVRILASGAPVSVPQSFLGVSTEYWTIPIWASHLSLLGRVLSTITSRPGAIVLRIGGASSDQAFWYPAIEAPEWVFEIRRSWLGQVSRIINGFGVRVILDLNLVTATPQAAVRWARAAEAALPPGSVVGFEIGNEPDIYRLAEWRRLTGGVGSRALPQRMTAEGYSSSYRGYASALARVDPGVALLGPALSEPAANLRWITRLLENPHPGLRAITVHRYPLSACSHRGSKTFPTIRRVLSESTTAGMVMGIGDAVRTARRAGLPVRLSEINSVTCGGRKGVSDTFATALWAPDALFELLRAGARSVAVHVRANTINTAFSLTRRGLVAYPLLYGLSVFSRTLGPNSQLLPLRLIARPHLGLKAWAVRVGSNTLHVLLIDKSAQAARVSLQIPRGGPAIVQRLLAPSARATSGITLGGQYLDSRGQWVGRPTSERIHRGTGGYQITVRGISATLVTVALGPKPA